MSGRRVLVTAASPDRVGVLANDVYRLRAITRPHRRRCRTRPRSVWTLARAAMTGMGAAMTEGEGLAAALIPIRAPE